MYDFFMADLRFHWDIPEPVLAQIHYYEQKTDFCCEYECVYRGTHSEDNLEIADFLPSCIEHPSSLNPFVKPARMTNYSVSLNLDMDALLGIISSSSSLKASIHSISQGKALRNYGIPIRRNLQNTHVDFLLFDWESNNPFSEFVIIEKYPKE